MALSFLFLLHVFFLLLLLLLTFPEWCWMVSIYWTSKNWLIAKLGRDWTGRGNLFDLWCFIVRNLFFQNRSWIIQIWGALVIFSDVCLYIFVMMHHYKTAQWQF